MKSVDNIILVVAIVMLITTIPLYIDIYKEISLYNNQCRCIDNSLFQQHDRVVMWTKLNKLSGKGVMYISEGDYLYFCSSVKTGAF
jgi:hypothetical protein